MGSCFPYRFLVCALAGIGMCIIVCMRSAFVLVATQTSRGGNLNESDVMIYPNCTVYNTSKDYASSYTADTTMQFHSVYYIGLMLGIVSGGHVTYRFPIHRVMGVAIFVISLLATLLPTVYQTSAVGVFIIRFSHGLIEGIAQTPIPALVSTWSLEHERSTMTSLIQVGFNLSPAISNPIAGACLCYISWDSSLYIFGASGIFWSLIWAWIAYPAPQKCPYLSKYEAVNFAAERDTTSTNSKSCSQSKKIPWKLILKSKAVWAIWLPCFCRNFVMSMLSAIQPQLFKDVFNIRVADIGLLLSIPFITNSLVLYLCSVVSDRLINSNYLSTTNVRKLMQCIGTLGESAGFVAMVYADNWQTSFIFLTLAFSVGGISFSGSGCNALDLSPEYASAVASIVLSGIGGAAFSTFVASLITGDDGTSRDWSVLFWVEAAIGVFTVVIYLLFSSAERQPWGNGDELAQSEKLGSEEAKDKTRRLMVEECVELDERIIKQMNE